MNRTLVCVKKDTREKIFTIKMFYLFGWYSTPQVVGWGGGVLDTKCAVMGEQGM